MAKPDVPHGHTRRRIAGTGVLALGAAAGVAAVLLDWSVPARAAIIAATRVVLWLGELAPGWLPTVLLWVATPLLLASASDAFAPARVLGWSVDPVLALFLGGFALAAAASAQGAERAVAALALRLSRGRPVRLVVMVALATAMLSMWMSNVAAAALMLDALRPVVDGDASPSGSLRRPLLLAIALAADVGGIATPVGTGSNGIAMAALERTHPISFVQWMAFGVPLAFGLLAAALGIVVWRVRPAGVVALPKVASSLVTASTWRLGAVFGATILLWLTEPLHGVRAWVVALGAVAALVLAGLLGWRDVRRMDWSTLLLIAGGIALGALLDESGLVRAGASYVQVASAPPFVRLLALCLVSGVVSRDEQHRDGGVPRAAGPDARPRAVDRHHRGGIDLARGAVRHQHAAERHGGRDGPPPLAGAAGAGVRHHARRMRPGGAHRTGGPARVRHPVARPRTSGSRAAPNVPATRAGSHADSPVGLSAPARGTRHERGARHAHRAFAIRVGLHSLIHLLGPTKAYGWAEGSQLRTPIGPLGGALWLAAAMLIVGAAYSFALGAHCSTRRRSTAQALALRARIVLARTDRPDASHGAPARAFGVHRATVGIWRTRFAARRLAGLADDPRVGAPRTVTAAAVERVVATTLEHAPPDATRWSTRGLAKAVGLGQATVVHSRRVRPAAAPSRDLHALHRSTVRGEGGRHLDQKR